MDDEFKPPCECGAGELNAEEMRVRIAGSECAWCEIERLGDACAQAILIVGRARENS